MNKAILTIAILGLLILLSSAYYSSPSDSRLGYKAPSLVLGDGNNGLAPLQQHRGDNVLLTFWSSDDALSRLANQHYDRLSRVDGVHYTHVSVNMDRSNAVFSSIVAIDSLNRSAQYNSTADAQANIIKSWRLDDGYHSFLLDTDGKIIAIDPDEKTLANLH